MNLEISHSLLIESQKGLKQIEQVLKGEGQAKHSEATEAILRVLNRIHSCAAVLELDNLSDYTLCLSQAMVTLRDAEARLSKELTTVLLRTVDLLREVIPAAVRGRSDPIPQYSLEQLSRICEEMALVGKTDTLSGTQGGASIFRPDPSTMKHVVEIADAIRSA